jgi:hypothetical protein
VNSCAERQLDVFAAIYPDFTPVERVFLPLRARFSPDRIGVREELVHQRLIDYDYFACTGHLCFAQQPAAFQLKSKRWKIPLAAQLADCLPLFGMCDPWNIDFTANATLRRQRRLAAPFNKATATPGLKAEEPIRTT